MTFRTETGDFLPTLRRATRVSLSFVTQSKRRRLKSLESAFRGAVNRFIEVLWNNDKATRRDASWGRLMSFLANEAFRVARTTVTSTRLAAKTTGNTISLPRYTGGVVLAGNVSVKFCDSKTLDLVVTMPSLVKGQPLKLTTKATYVLRKWLAFPGARIANFVEVHGDRLTLVVEAPRPTKRTDGQVLGVDVGMTKLLATSDGEFLGTEFRSVAEKIKRRRLGSKSRASALRERDHLVNRSLNQLPWGSVKALAFEDLKGIKTGRRHGQSKSFRRTRSSWSARRVRERASSKCEERGVWLIDVDPRHNSQTCPQCGHREPMNRNGSVFRCRQCRYLTDADYVGAVNTARKAEKALPLILLAAKAKADELASTAAQRAAEREKKKEARRLKVQATWVAKKKNVTASGPERPGVAAKVAKAPRGTVSRRGVTSAKAPVLKAVQTTLEKAPEVRSASGTGVSFHSGAGLVAPQESPGTLACPGQK